MKYQLIIIALSAIFSASFSASMAYGKQPDTKHPGAVAVDAKIAARATTEKPTDPATLGLLAQGQKAFNARDYKKAFRLWYKLALQGHSEAQVFVGLAYKNGWGMRTDQKLADMWFQIAAEGGNPSAQFFVGLHYLSSNNPELVPIGINWLVTAARNGEVSARQFLLKAKRRQWFQVPDNLEVSAKVTPVTASNIDKVFTSDTQSSQPKTTSPGSSSSLKHPLPKQQNIQANSSEASTSAPN